jgi:predicted dehydrogenase
MPTGSGQAKFRVGLVGPGSIGRTHIAAIAELPALELVGMAGGVEGEARRAAPGIRWWSEPQYMIAEAAPDIVVVATPGGAHFKAARAAIEAGCHVVVEKPLAVDPAEAADLAARAARSGRVCATISQRRLEPQHAYLKSLLETGRLGRLRLIEAFVHWHRTDAYYAESPWRGTVEQGGGSLMNQGIHSLDLMLWLAGPAASVSAFSDNLSHRQLAIEDTSLAALKFESGALGMLATTTATPPGYPAELRLFTEAGHCHFSHADIRAWDFPGIAPPGSTAAIASGAADPAAIGVAGHLDQWRDILDAIQTGRLPAVTFKDGFEAVRTIAAIYRSSAENRHVDLSEFPLRSLPDGRAA